MKNEKTIILAIAVYAAAMIMIFNIIGANAQEHDPVKSANAANEKKSDKDIVDEDEADFLVKSADARMTDAQGRKTQKGTSSKIREYEQTMVRDKSTKKRNIMLPRGVSDKKVDGREDLTQSQLDNINEIKIAEK